MATYTTNFGLYKPDNSDDFKDFRAEHNNNMDIIDQNLGGGSRHTIVDENGTDMPNENRLQFTGGVTVTDDNVNGVTVVDVTKDIVLTNQTLNFSGNTATITNANMTADTLFFVFYHDTVEAGNCGITADGSLNTITFTVGDTPSSPIVCDIIIKQ